MVARALGELRAAGPSIHFDLVYGLPDQTTAALCPTFGHCLDASLTVDPDQRQLRCVMIDFGIAENIRGREPIRDRASWMLLKSMLPLWGPAALACAPPSRWPKPIPLLHLL